MKFLILGAGAVGLSMAAMLSEVADVTAVARGETARECTRKGFSISGAWGYLNTRFPCCTEPPVDEVFDYVLVTTKAYSTRDICHRYAGDFPGAEFVSFQNGIGSAEIIASFTGRVIGGVVMSGFIRTGPGHVHVTGNAGESLFGRYPCGIDEGVRAFTDLLGRSGIPARPVPDIRDHIWSKNLISCTLNPLSAILGVEYGSLTGSHTWQIISEITREYFRIAVAEGVTLAWSTPEQYLHYLGHDLIPLMSTHTSSMLQDIRKGRMTEIGFMNGAIYRHGERHGIDAPYNRCIAELVEFLEKKELREMKLSLV